MPTVELIYDTECPNAEAAREQLRRALTQAGLECEWREWRIGASDAPTHTHGFGSPTILVNQQDVAGTGGPNAAACCRLYTSNNGSLRGVPDIADIVASLRGGANLSQDCCSGSIPHGNPELSGRAITSRSAGWFGAALAVPGALLSLLPSFACPVCLAAYAGVLSTLGLGFVLTESVLAPLIIAFLLVGVASVAWTTRSHRRAGPLLTMVAGSGAVVAGRLVWNTPAVLYVGIALVIGASVWNLWLKRPVRSPLVRPRRGAVVSHESIQGEPL